MLIIRRPGLYFVLMCFVEVIDDVIAKKNSYISSQDCRNFCLHCSRHIKLWIHSRQMRVQDSFPPKMTPDETSKTAPRQVL